jgi:hypothetical protein
VNAGPTKRFFGCGDTICLACEAVLKLTSPTSGSAQTEGSVMWAFIVGLIYNRSCKRYLARMAAHQHRWI